MQRAKLKEKNTVKPNIQTKIISKNQIKTKKSITNLNFKNLINDDTSKKVLVGTSKLSNFPTPESASTSEAPRSFKSELMYSTVKFGPGESLLTHYEKEFDTRHLPHLPIISPVRPALGHYEPQRPSSPIDMPNIGLGGMYSNPVIEQEKEILNPLTSKLPRVRTKRSNRLLKPDIFTSQRVSFERFLVSNLGDYSLKGHGMKAINLKV